MAKATDDVMEARMLAFESLLLTLKQEQTQPEGLLFSPEDRDLLLVRWVFTRYASKNMRKNGRFLNVRAHRVILRRVLGRPLTRHDYVDHINGQRLDNRRENLRITDARGNSGNKHICHSCSGYFGVQPQGQAWHATIRYRLDGTDKTIYLGRYDDPIAAAIAYDRASELFGRLTRNFRRQ